MKREKFYTVVITACGVEEKKELVLKTDVPYAQARKEIEDYVKTKGKNDTFDIQDITETLKIHPLISLKVLDDLIKEGKVKH